MSRTILADVDGFTPVIDTVMKDTSLITAVVFGRMWRYCQMPNGVCQAALDKIAEGAGLSKQAVIEHIKILEENKYIEDMTPNLRNRPHTYRDTGKAGLHLTLSTLNVVYRETSSTLNDVDSALNVDDSHVKQRLIEDSIKKESKIQPEPSKKGTGSAFEEMNQKHAEAEQRKQAMMDRVEKAIHVRPSMSNPKWETVINKLLKIESTGETIERYAEWANGDKYNSPKTAQIANKPTIILDTWPAAFTKKDYGPVLLPYAPDPNANLYVPAPEDL